MESKDTKPPASIGKQEGDQKANGASPAGEGVLPEKLKLVALRVPSRKCGLFMSTLKPKKLLLHIKRVKPVINDPDPPGDARSTKLILLNPKIQDLKLSALPSDIRELCEKNGAETLWHILTIDHTKHLTLQGLIRSILPPNVPATSSFETVGHVVHLNLLDAQMPYKKAIGDVVLKKLQDNHVRSVVVKTGRITDQFRVFPMEVIAGEKNLVTELREHGCKFKLDYGKVYWNSRLQTEHARIVSTLKHDSIVCDMFCGIGPFAVPAARRGATVYANDLNPESYRWLKENVKLNKVEDKVTCFNEDARVFLRKITRELIEEKRPMYNVVTMNLPATAIEFLDAFQGLFPKDFTQEQMPRIHCYCFSRGETLEEMIKGALERASGVLGSKLTNASVHNVRDVAPKKNMLCLSFHLPLEVAAERKDSSAGPSGTKRVAETKALDNCKRLKS
ncbi:hypothetical protein AAMO2058_000858100 [Amorphochlora amoebiformis]